MKRIQSLDEINIGDRVFVDEGKKEVIVKSKIDKLIPYIIATDNSGYSVDRGLWKDCIQTV